MDRGLDSAVETMMSTSLCGSDKEPYADILFVLDGSDGFLVLDLDLEGVLSRCGSKRDPGVDLRLANLGCCSHDAFLVRALDRFPAVSLPTE